MEICHNCRNKESEYNCDICRRTYCQNCDKYIHSFSSKNKHSRTKILYNTSPIKSFEFNKNKYTIDENGFYVYTGNKNKKYFSIYENRPLLKKEKNNFNQISDKNIYNGYLSPKANILRDKFYFSPNQIDMPKITYNLDCNDKNNIKSKQLSLSPQTASDTLNETEQSIKRTKSFNSTMAKNNLISYDEKIRLMKKISQLNCELSNTRSNIDQKLDILREHIHNYNEENKKEMAELNYKNINEINIISSQKDTLIKHLKDVMEDQEETIQKLLNKKTKLEEEIHENKFLIDKYTNEKNNYIKEKENDEILFKEKKNLLEQKHECEMQKIRNDYDNELDRLSNNYIQTRNEYLNEIKKGNDKIEEFKIKGQKEIESLSSEINDLQNENNMTNKEQEKIINKNKDLKKSLNDFNGKYDETTIKYKNSKDERDRILKSYNNAMDEVKRRKRENEKLHDLKYGRF